jgi:hypothetical protein
MVRMIKPLFGLLIALLLFAPAQAGGWSVVILDSGGALDPNGPNGRTIEAGVPFTVGFTVLQHGNKPMRDLSPTLAFTSKSTNEKVSFKAQPEGKIGHYVATVSLPASGTWNWEIDAFGPVATMAPIDVIAPKITVSENQATAAPLTLPPLLPAGVFLVVLLSFAALLFLRRKRAFTQRTGRI